MFDPAMIGLFVPLGFFATVACIVVGRPMAKAIAAKAEAEAKSPQIPGEVQNRLERMEHSIDAIAVAVSYTHLTLPTNREV